MREIVFVRRGSFVVHHRGREILANPNRAVLLDPGDRYRIEHPVGTRDSRLAAPDPVNVCCSTLSHLT